MRLPIWRRLGWRLGAAFVLVASASILASGLVQYRAQEASLRQSLGALLLNIARTGSLLVDGDLHARVAAEGRQESEGYGRIRDRLLLIQETNALGEAGYTLTDVEGERARFGVISNGLAAVGSEYRLAGAIQPMIRRVLADGVPVYTDLYTGPDGAWISAFAPIRDSAQRTVAVLAVDFRADTYMAELAAVRRRLYASVAAGALLALVSGMALARHITRPLAELQGLARAVVEGDLTRRLRVRTRDEIGLLANVFHLMVERLQVSQRSVVEVLVRALEARDGGAGSLDRLAAASRELGARLGLSTAQQEALELGARLHDIGDVRTPEAILASRGPLSVAERTEIEPHPP